MDEFIIHGKLENISIDPFRETLDGVNDPKARKRLMLAILYKQGRSIPMIGVQYDMRDETIHRWFTKMEEEPL